MERRGQVTIVAALMLLVLIAPSASAMESSGQFLVSGSVQLPSGASLVGQPLGLYTEDADHMTALALSASHARLYVLEQKRTVVSPPVGESYTVAQPVRTVFDEDLTDLRLVVPQGRMDEGWVGVYPTSASLLEMKAGAPTDVAAREFSTLGPAQDPLAALSGANDQSDQPTQRRYYQSIAQDHLYLETTGALDVTGPMSLKALGPALRVASREFSGEFETGRVSDSGTVHDETYRWAFVSLQEGSLHVETLGVIQVALQGAASEWSGLARFTPVRGELDAGGDVYAAQAQPAAVQGDFSSTLAPRRDANRLFMAMSLDGRLASTTLQSQSALLTPARGASSDLPWLALFAFGAVVVTGSAGAAVLVTRRRRAVALALSRQPETDGLVGPYDGLHADDFMRLADEAAVERRWARALQWARRARELAPANARIRADEGEYLFQLGLFEEALQAFAEASRLDGSEGYADYRGAQAAAAAGRPVDEVLAWLERALERSPDLVGDLELFREFETMRGLPGYERMVRDAYARLGIDPAPPS